MSGTTLSGGSLPGIVQREAVGCGSCEATLTLQDSGRATKAPKVKPEEAEVRREIEQERIGARACAC